MTDPVVSATVIEHPAMNRRVQDAESLRFTMAEAARRRAIHQKASCVRSSSTTQSHKPLAVKPSPLTNKALLWVCAGVACGLGLWLLNTPDTNPSSTRSVVRDSGVAFEAINQSGLTPQGIEANLRAPHTAVVLNATKPLSTTAKKVVATAKTLPPPSKNFTSNAAEQDMLATQPPVDPTSLKTAIQKPAGRSEQLLQFPLSSSQAVQQPINTKTNNQPSPRARVISVPVDGMVNVDFDGAVRLYRVGQTLPNGQTVLSADAASGKFNLSPGSDPGN